MDLSEYTKELERAESFLAPLNLLKPNPWNPNEVDEKTWTALRESITKYGVSLQPVVVRPHGEGFQILDGEHRYKVAYEMGMKQIPVVVVDVGDNDAKKLTQILNRTRGQDNPVKLKELYDSLLVDMTPAELIEGLPIADAGELDALLEGLDREIMSEYDLGDDEGEPDESEEKKTCPHCGKEL